MHTPRRTRVCMCVCVCRRHVSHALDAGFLSPKSSSFRCSVKETKLFLFLFFALPLQSALRPLRVWRTNEEMRERESRNSIFFFYSQQTRDGADKFAILNRARQLSRPTFLYKSAIFYFSFSLPLRPVFLLFSFLSGIGIDGWPLSQGQQRLVM